MKKRAKELDAKQSIRETVQRRFDNTNWRLARFGDRVVAVSEDGCLLPYEPLPEDLSAK